MRRLDRILRKTSRSDRRRHVTVVQAQSRHKADKTEGKRIVGRERAVTSHARPFSLAVEVDQIEQVATLEDGLLRLTLPQRGTPRTVQIKAA